MSLTFSSGSGIDCLLDKALTVLLCRSCPSQILCPLYHCQAATCPDSCAFMQNLQRDFVSGVLSEEELGNKIHVHEAQHDYVARVHNPRSYDAIASDILQRWSFPFTPDTNLLPLDGPWGPSSYNYNRHNIYKCELCCSHPCACHHSLRVHSVFERRLIRRLCVRHDAACKNANMLTLLLLLVYTI